MAKTVNVALIGYKFMGRAHSNALRQAPVFFPDLPIKPVMKVLVGRNRDAVKAVADQFGWEEIATDWREVVERDDIHVIDIGSPGNTHAEIAIAAAKAGKHIICEKPLANSLEEAKAMVQAAREAGVTTLCNYNYRRVPAVRLAKKLIESGALGEIRHYRGTYLQDWITDPNFPLVWRLRKEIAGAGALGDIGSHTIDLCRYLVGEVTRVTALTKTFIKQRPLPAEDMGAWGSAAGGGVGEVTVDDAALIIAELENGAVASFEATRFALGRKNYNRFEINGSKGSIAFNFERMNELEFYDGTQPSDRQGWSVILATNAGDHEYISHWWPPGHPIGYEHTFVHAVVDFLYALDRREQPNSDFLSGAQTDAVVDAVLKSAESGQWVTVERLT
ncbi:MAG: Gfo/Idh/MocA family oxidoreductase [Anaerolineae bacterium]|nr:Gfo/Idh/MocA family oxidoreductase [Anaerolineae bacterium]MDW8099180.1 Gfo/Idh/MocA family oxidoreductase [Anaerolineae bacterium]